MAKTQLDDVATDDTGAAIGNGNEDRVALLERINDQNDQLRAEELADIAEGDQLEAFVPNPVDTQKEDEDAESVVPDSPAVEEPTQEVRKFKIKVNGVEQELTEQEVLERAQKVAAADQYLQEAARMRQEAEMRATQQPQLNFPTLPQPDARELLEERRALVRAIQMGTEEEAMAAMDRWTQLNASPSISPDEVARTVDERLTFKQAVDAFQNQYKDIVDDPMLRRMALQRDQELIQAGDKRGYWDRFSQIGNELRSWKENLVKSSAPPPTANLTDKQERKAAAPSVPKTSSAKNTPAPAADDEPETPQQIIANMAKSRGGPQWMRS